MYGVVGLSLSGSRPQYCTLEWKKTAYRRVIVTGQCQLPAASFSLSFVRCWVLLGDILYLRWLLYVGCRLWLSVVAVVYCHWLLIFECRLSGIAVTDSDDYTAKKKCRKLEAYIPRKGISGPQSQFPHSCVCERIIYSHDGAAVSAGGNMWTDPGNI